MNWKVQFNEKFRMVILTYSGFTSVNDLYDSTISVIDLTNSKGAYKILVDSRNVLTDSTRADIFKFPSELYSKLGMNRATRIAIMEPKDLDAQNIAYFYELAAKNLGWEAKIHDDRKQAVQWLQGD